MRKKMMKLAVAVAILAGGLALGATARPANAAGFCSDICCDSQCFSVRHCFGHAGSCICEEFCTVE